MEFKVTPTCHRQLLAAQVFQLLRQLLCSCQRGCSSVD